MKNRKSIWNNNDGFVEAQTIIDVVVILIVLTILLAVASMISSIQNPYEPTYFGSFDVTDRTVDLQCQTNERGMDNLVVTIYYNDGSSVEIFPPNYSYSGSVVTVDQDVL